MVILMSYELNNAEFVHVRDVVLRERKLMNYCTLNGHQGMADIHEANAYSALERHYRILGKVHKAEQYKGLELRLRKSEMRHI